MPRPRRDPTDAWAQLQLLVPSPEQHAYEVRRPIVLLGQPIPIRARETGVPERTLRRTAARFDAHGMHGRFDLATRTPATTDRRLLPPEIRQAIIELKAEHPALGLREIAGMCRHRFARDQPPHRRRRACRRGAADPIERRRSVVTLYLDGWSVKAIAGYLETSRPTVYAVVRRWDEEGWPNLLSQGRRQRVEPLLR